MKLYLITRQDLPPGVQAAQLVHAMRQFSEDHPEVDRDWFENSNTIVLLAASNEGSLGVVADRARCRGIPVACFREPDRDNELTAIALGPEGKSLTRKLPLALSWSSSSPYSESPPLSPS